MCTLSEVLVHITAHVAAHIARVTTYVTSQKTMYVQKVHIAATKKGDGEKIMKHSYCVLW